MNNKIFFKIGWIFILSFIFYLTFILYFLLPNIDNYFFNKQIKSDNMQFNTIITTISSKAKRYEDENLILTEINQLLENNNLNNQEQIYIFDNLGRVLVDKDNEFKSENISNLILPNNDNKIFFQEIKKAYKNKTTLEYKWNKTTDINNYKYPKLFWVECNKDLKWYIVSSIYSEDFSLNIKHLNLLIITLVIFSFLLFFIISIFIIFKILFFVNTILEKILQSQIKIFDINIKEDKSTFIVNKFNNLVNKIEENRERIHKHSILKKTKEISDKLYYDELTGLKNRYALQDEINDLEFVSIALIDIDTFDDINELYGFSTGNLVLIETSTILKEFAIKYDTSVNRIYGNVFSITDKKMMPFSEFNKFILELSTLFKTRTIFIKDLNIEIHIDITLGISISQEEPLKTAGIALKKAKKSNQRFFVYNNELDRKEIIEESIFWRDKIKNALINNNVLPFYQAIYNSNKEIVKYETLMRIKDIDENGKVSYILPSLFLNIAVKTKQYLQLSNNVILKALSDLDKTDKKLSFNLSFKDILDLEFVRTLDAIFNDISTENKNRIVFEILEGDYISNYEILEDFINKYREQGVQIAIDDFGTGYSNFSHILKIKPDYIKIDGSLIKDIITDKNSYEMVKSIIRFSKALDIKVIAEYVHTEEVFNLLNKLEVDEFQGFYLAEPTLYID